MNIRFPKNLLVLSICVFLAAGCRKDDDGMPEPAAAGTAATNDPATVATQTPPATGADTATSGDLSGEKSALANLNVVNDHEIAAGRQALSKGVAGEVKAFAELMIQAHSDNRAKTEALQPGSPNEEGQALKTKGETELADLAKLEGDAYSKAYVDAMVKGHEEALALLDGKLIPAAVSDGAKAHLTETRGHVADHLQRAKALQGQTSR